MFTGIIKSIGEIKKINKKEHGSELAIELNDTANVSVGSSVCVSGVCLTVAKKDGQSVSFDIMPETLKKTTLGAKKEDNKVNIETTLKVGDELGGHFVYGHVDGVANVKTIINQGDNRLIEFSAVENIMKYIVPQGSIAVDGVSLTVANFTDSAFTVSLIPFTLENTTLGSLSLGDEVNIESDMIAKLSRINKY